MTWPQLRRQWLRFGGNVDEPSRTLDASVGHAVLLYHEGWGVAGRPDCSVWPTPVDPTGTDRFDMNIVDVTPGLIEELAEIYGLI